MYNIPVLNPIPLNQELTKIFFNQYKPINNNCTFAGRFEVKPGETKGKFNINLTFCISAFHGILPFLKPQKPILIFNTLIIKCHLPI